MVHIFDQESGYMLSQEHMRVAEVIHQWDPTVELAWVPPDNRLTAEDFNKPFALIHKPGDKPDYIIRKLREDEVDHRLIGWLWMSDTARTGEDLAEKVTKEAEAKAALGFLLQRDEMMEKHELAASILASPLNTYKHDGVKYQ
jgi:hypothetical protein